MFHYFGYGSNMDLVSLQAKGVRPRASHRARLAGWRLRFNVKHFFHHEGGVGNICPADDGTARVEGVVHLCEDAHLPGLDAAEACGFGYDRIKVDVATDEGIVRATAYVGVPSFLDDTCLPSRRYLNILLSGAKAAGVDDEYLTWLAAHPVHPKRVYPTFEHPAGEVRTFDEGSLAAHPTHTALAGAVFDMEGARWQHEFLKGLFGGKDMTLFHLKRLDTSDGNETIEDVKRDRLDPGQRDYLNEFLNEYDAEYRYVGRFDYG
jgi:gamma-glutamylcyclotransferase (GGCT)/AIG2-like uncharacterized protein YtfP